MKLPMNTEIYWFMLVSTHNIISGLAIDRMTSQTSLPELQAEAEEEAN